MTKTRLRRLYDLLWGRELGLSSAQVEELFELQAEFDQWEPEAEGTPHEASTATVPELAADRTARR